MRKRIYLDLFESLDHSTAEQWFHNTVVGVLSAAFSVVVCSNIVWIFLICLGIVAR